MGRPTSRAALLAAMDATYLALVQEVGLVPVDSRDRSGACAAWSVKDLLAHLAAWHDLFLGWVADAEAGGSPAIPAPGHTWRTTPALNEELRLRAWADTWDAVMARLDESHAKVRALIAGSGDDLFDKGVVRWTGSTSVGAYAVSATSSHYAWALDLVRGFRKGLSG
jgi:hypothetical protein